MAKLEDLKPDLKVKGIVPGQVVSIVDVKWHGSTAIELFYKRDDGQPGTQLLFRNYEISLEIVETRQTWHFSADGELFRLVAEDYRIHLAHLFDPVLAVHTSVIEPLPRQITGVYGEMLVLGHESITTTMIYTDPDEDIVHQAHHQYSPVNEVDLNGGS